MFGRKLTKNLCQTKNCLARTKKKVQSRQWIILIIIVTKTNNQIIVYNRCSETNSTLPTNGRFFIAKITCATGGKKNRRTVLQKFAIPKFCFKNNPKNRGNFFNQNV